MSGLIVLAVPAAKCCCTWQRCKAARSKQMQGKNVNWKRVITIKGSRADRYGSLALPKSTSLHWSGLSTQKHRNWNAEESEFKKKTKKKQSLGDISRSETRDLTYGTCCCINDNDKVLYHCLLCAGPCIQGGPRTWWNHQAIISPIVNIIYPSMGHKQINTCVFSIEVDELKQFKK